MGCHMCKADAAAAPSGRPSSPKTQQVGPSKQDVEFIASEPDLGWRLLPASMEVADAAPPSQLYPEPDKWMQEFFNERNGSMFKGSLVVLAINIAVRAADLAEGFGVHMLDPQGAGDQPPVETLSNGEPYDRSKVYRDLRVPDYRWHLLDRRWQPPPHASHAPRYNEPGPGGTGQNVRDKAVLQRMRKDAGKLVAMDVAEMGMNIAEQLFRLERSQTSKHNLPTDTFGWQVRDQYTDGNCLVVTSPDGDARWIVPEELILAVVTWVQEVYLTSSVLVGS